MLNQCYRQCMRDHIEVISVDMFDTLVFRQLGTSRTLFLSLAASAHSKGLWNDDFEAFVALRCHAEEEARLLAQASGRSREILLDDIYEQVPYLDTKTWSQLEIETELNNWHLNQELVELLKNAQQQGKKLVLLSDMYLPEKTIAAFWERACPELDWLDIRVSGSRKQSKADGSAYHSLLHHLNLNAANVLHVGDDLLTDVQMAQGAGLDSYHLKQPDYLREIHKLEDVICTSSIPGLLRLRQAVSLSQAEQAECSYYRLGALLYGPVLVGFARWIITVCKAQGITRLYCLLREGGIIAEIIQTIDPDFDVHTLAISRRSSFLPYIGELTQSNLYKLSERRGYSLSELSDDVDQALPESLAKYRNELLSDLINHACWSLICEWIDEKNIEINQYLFEQKRLLKRYLEEQGVCNSSSQGILDWGCGGSLLITISQLLCLSDNQYMMFYRKPAAQTLAIKGGLHCFQPLSISKQAEALITSPELSEILLNQHLLSTTSYLLTSSGVEPQCKDVGERNREALAHFRDGVFKCLSVSIRQQWLAGGVDVTSRARLFSILYRLIEFPLHSEAVLLSDLQVPISDQKTESLLPNSEWMKLRQYTAEACWNSYLRAVDEGLKRRWWFTGMIALAFPGYLQQQGHFFRQFDDDLLAVLLLNALQQKGVKDVVVYGAGELGAKVHSLLSLNGITTKSFIDRRAERYKFRLAGLPVYALENAQIPPQTHIVVASRVFAEEIYRTLVKRFPGDIDNIIRIK